ncbi:hypothetical protein LX16_0443 [Stackebrandtia albiflava]|uniref:Uncharacterized protein n=1 Tax=Stackebrandtia albiflava TaxID=406432 RepID=A0A562VA78_9ACTN|nr:transcriptional regulator [Stackebrandtia albiflava]TWJ14753.1 hypothetical protein LX16_0443 [Stackebrandtia albiflava]
MTHHSTPHLRILHAVRLLGFAAAPAIARHAGADDRDTAHTLADAERRGWVQHVAFADLDGWSLTDDGKTENERQLAAERAVADPAGAVAAVHRDFLPLNARLVEAVTDWQIAPTADDRLAVNDHTDPARDAGVLRELAALGTALRPLNARLTEVLSRFDGYAGRFDSALRRAGAGQTDWVDKTHVDSCHRVWFQLHEDLVATLGIDRRAETGPG